MDINGGGRQASNDKEKPKLEESKGAALSTPHVTLPNSRLASIHAKPQQPASETVDPALLQPRQTTLGGIQKTKFTPTITTRKVPANDLPSEPSAPPSASMPPGHDKKTRGGRGRGRGGPGFGSTARSNFGSRRGLLFGTGQQTNSPLVVSGPFSLGPARAAASARHSGATFGHKHFVDSNRSAWTRDKGSLDKGHNSDDKFLDSKGDKLSISISLNDLTMNDPYSPLFFSNNSRPSQDDSFPSNHSKKGDELNDPTKVDLSESKLFLFQLPPVLPKPSVATSHPMEESCLNNANPLHPINQMLTQPSVQSAALSAKLPTTPISDTSPASAQGHEEKAEEIAIDLETFQKHQEAAAAAIHQQMQQKSYWPAGYDGQIGRLLIMESGKMVLEINQTRFYLETRPGINSANQESSDAMLQSSGFVNKLFAIDPDYEQSFEIGPVLDGFVAFPDLEELVL